MMRSFAGAMPLLAILCLCLTRVQAQKKILTDTSYKNWSWLYQGYQLSNDGRFVSYDVHAYDRSRYFGVLATSKGEEITRISKRSALQFSGDSRYLVSELTSDSILVFDLVKRKPKLAVAGKGFQLNKTGKNNWLVYMRSDSVFVHNLETGYSAVYPGVKEYQSVSSGTAVVLRKETALIWLDLSRNESRTVFNGGILRLTISSDVDHLAFFHKKGNDLFLYHFEPSMTTAVLAASDKTEGIAVDHCINDGGIVFSPDGRLLYFELRKISRPRTKDPDLLTNEVEVWHYRQPNIYWSQRWYNPDVRQFRAVINLTEPGARVIQLETDSMAIAGNPGNQYMIVKSNELIRQEEEYFNEEQAPLYQLVSLKDGSRKTFRPRSSRLWHASLSKNERFITWVNKDDQDLYAYEIATGITRNLTSNLGLQPDMILINQGSPALKIELVNDGWVGDDERLMIQDKYDCWLLDPLGKQAPVNITNGYGRRNRISFRPALDEGAVALRNGDIILRARDERTGDNGFWQTKLTGGNPVQKTMGAYKFSDPVMKIMQPCMFSWNKIHEPPRLRKAKNAAIYIVTRQSASESINLFVSTDLRSFRQISSIHPEKEYNWMSSEMITYRKKDGDTGQAYLYKPDNFDPSKKYPVIFQYYQTRITEMHDYHRAGNYPNEIDIPWYVSNGYLVCIPDINHYKPGRIAETVVNSVEGAARYLSRFPWVDSTKFGAQGHSFGGYETLLLIAHSRMFAAAQASAAVSDIVSAIGGTAFGDHELYTWYETGQANMGPGNLPWSNPQGYIENSPIFYADKITTPLLLMHGYQDENVKFWQDIEMFTALRRLQKPVWILAYKDGHIIADHNELGKDAAIRQRQFFDHYLKGKPAPVWMTEGVNPEDRDYKSGLQLDMSGAKP